MHASSDVPDIRNNGRILGDQHVFVQVVPQDAVRKPQRYDWIPTLALQSNPVHVRHLLAIVERRQARRPDDAVDFFLCFLLDVGIEGHRQHKAQDR